MTTSVLVAYATSYGSTQEVAESIAKTLRDAGLAVDVQPARQVKALSGYGAVVIGAPLYMFHLHADARHFLNRFRSTLASLPSAIFALGPFHNKEDELSSARQQLDKELIKYAWLKPLCVEVFVGKFDPARLRFPYNLMPPLKNMPACDERDWENINAWAVKTGQALVGSV